MSAERSAQMDVYSHPTWHRGLINTNHANRKRDWYSRLLNQRISVCKSKYKIAIGCAPTNWAVRVASRLASSFVLWRLLPDQDTVPRDTRSYYGLVAIHPAEHVCHPEQCVYRPERLSPSINLLEYDLLRCHKRVASRDLYVVRIHSINSWLK